METKILFCERSSGGFARKKYLCFRLINKALKYRFPQFVFVFLCAFLLLPLAMRAVDQDSLFRSLETMSPDSDQVNLLNDYGRAYKTSDPEIAQRYFH